MILLKFPSLSSMFLGELSFPFTSTEDFEVLTLRFEKNYLTTVYFSVF